MFRPSEQVVRERLAILPTFELLERLDYMRKMSSRRVTSEDLRDQRLIISELKLRNLP